MTQDKPTLATLPTELVIMIFKQLDKATIQFFGDDIEIQIPCPVSWVCLGLTCKAFYKIFKMPHPAKMGLDQRNGNGLYLHRLVQNWIVHRHIVHTTADLYWGDNGRGEFVTEERAREVLEQNCILEELERFEYHYYGTRYMDDVA
ncbi:hypothetical protein G7Y89_g14370 [Cudoniella acicularis]|uniref:F-box domain-containing protein n=1 Tax=Cudoniella acicularis TaxID=354080 RepID=A0A8H4R5G4_9HELO|nr:hypothetical protein G7Y89_g14370 [Cudoniella acicularis]